MRLFRRNKSSVLDEPIARVLSEMNTYGPDSEEYRGLVSHLESLVRLKAEEQSRARISPDTMAIVVGNIVGVLIVVSYERSHVLVSKALNAIIRPRDHNN